MFRTKVSERISQDVSITKSDSEVSEEEEHGEKEKHAVSRAAERVTVCESQFSV